MEKPSIYNNDFTLLLGGNKELSANLKRIPKNEQLKYIALALKFAVEDLPEPYKEIFKSKNYFANTIKEFNINAQIILDLQNAVSKHLIKLNNRRLEPLSKLHLLEL